MIIDAIFRCVVWFLLGLRYRIRVKGLDAVAAKGRRGILFLPNHPGLIDPVIIMALLLKRFRPRALGDKDQIERRGSAPFARHFRVLEMPDISVYGRDAREEINAALATCAQALRDGENLLLYPSGHTYRSRYEDMRGNTAVETILAGAPEARVVLIRTRGLWGSCFGWGPGRAPDVGANLRRMLRYACANFIFFGPRRSVNIEVVEPTDLPRSGRTQFNAYLEAFYNQDAPPNTYVPYSRWEKGGTRQVPEPGRGGRQDASRVPAATREQVLKHLRELSDRAEIHDADRLANDLGLDSLARTDVLLWVEKEFGFPQGDAEAVLTVGDLLLSACGQGTSGATVPLKSVPGRWFSRAPAETVQVPAGATIQEVFLKQAALGAGRAVVADQMRGVLTYRNLITGVLVLRPLIARLPGDRVGIMLPASAGATVVYLATLFAGKVPVMVNWTVGARNMRHCLDVVGVKVVLTAGQLIETLKRQGTDLSAASDRFLLLEQLTHGVSTLTKLRALATSYLSWRGLRQAPTQEHAVILFTSGSEALPKAVPLSHQNILHNIPDFLTLVRLHTAEVMLGFLPPFHSFGLAITMVTPLVTGMRVVYFPNPMAGEMLARLIDAYQATLVCGTPTFMYGILQVASTEQLRSMRMVVTGAEKCPERVYAAAAERCPQAVFIEGYGITECSPVVAGNREKDPRRFAVGHVLPGYEYVILNEDTGKPVGAGEAGMLLVRGPSVFAGYLNYDGPSPFVDYGGKSWYRTGDVVQQEADGVIYFRGRKKRFVKLGGEMISLPAIEEVLEQKYAKEGSDGPALAVEATPSEEHPELVLFTTLDLTREAVNQALRSAGMSPLYNIRRVVRVEAIPVLGTGKTDYRALKTRLAEEVAGAGSAPKA